VLTPFAVDHGPKAPGAVGLVVQHSNRKIILTGDFLHIPNEDDPLLVAADVCFMDANTWHPADWTGHSSVLGNLRLIDKWKPKRVYFVHYSGYEDRERAGEPIHGPLTHGQFRDDLYRVRPDLELRLADHGMILGDSVDWPG
jgi:phosphoribosyl 1,2-cyclic phosphodiesterase